MVIIKLFEPDCDSGELDEAHEVGEQLVVSGRDAAELVEEALDDVALLIEVGVIATFEGPVALWRDDHLAAGFCDPVAEMIGVVALVGDRDVCGEAVDQFMREGDVVALPWRTDQVKQIGFGIAIVPPRPSPERAAFRSIP